MEDERVPPDDDGATERAHGGAEVGGEPDEVVREEGRLHHAGDVDQVAEVDHEELELDVAVLEEPQHEEEGHEEVVVHAEPRRVAHDDVLGEGDDEDAEGEGELVQQLDLRLLLQVVPDPLVGVAGDDPSDLFLGSENKLEMLNDWT